MNEPIRATSKPQLFLFGMAALALWFAFGTIVCAQNQGVGIAITQVPRWGEGGEYPREVIAGKVLGAVPAGCQVVIYTLTNVWWVQPYANSPLTAVTKTGSWKSTIALGKRYAALLVKSTFRPNATLSNLPEVGGDVLAIDNQEAKKK